MFLLHPFLFSLLATFVAAVTLTFDDLSVPNEGKCGSLSLTSTAYKGIHIANGGVFNTTKTQYCSGSSEYGAWGLTGSWPNLFAGSNLPAVFKPSVVGRKFKVPGLKVAVHIHWTLLDPHPELQVIVTTTGRKGGAVVKTEERVYGSRQVNKVWKLALSGYHHLESFEVKGEVRYIGFDGNWVRFFEVVYMDDVQVAFE